ncbi:hypothetical protein FRC11_013691, partial [Ceratobasidium sp. 423]
MVVAYKGKVSEYENSTELRSAIRLAMEFWFANEMSTVGDGTCMDREFLTPNNCPCGTPGLWGPNWFRSAASVGVFRVILTLVIMCSLTSSNVIQVPTLSGKACTLLRSDLTESELGNCTLIAARAYSPFYREPQAAYLSGANVIDIAVIGIAAGLLENNGAGNVSRIADAYARVHGEVVIRPGVGVDGIKPDGSFNQQGGIIYDGTLLLNHSPSNSLIELELQSLGTQFQANKTVQDIFGFHLTGSRWMTFTNVLKEVVHWDLELGSAWNQKDVIDFATSLTGHDDATANSGNLLGNRMFWSSDYMVHRTEQTVTTLKMLSNRSFTTQCINSEGPFGFHLSDGVLYTYSTGAEYEDMFAALDWNIPPGVTTDYGSIPLQCSTVRQIGIDPYAGGVQAGDVGMAAMRYINPLTKTFGFYKAWFFFPDNVQHVLVSNIKQSDTNSSSPVFSVLDQRLRSGDVYLNGALIDDPENGNFTEVESLWHGGTGYTFPNSRQPSRVSVSLQERTGDWSKLGTSKQPPPTVDMFAAWIVHERLTLNPEPNPPNSGAGNYLPVEYSSFPATSSNSDFEDKAARLQPQTVVNSETVSAAVSGCKKVFGAAFWTPTGGSVEVKEIGIKIEVDRGVILVLKFEDESYSKGTVNIADPTQGTGVVNVKIIWTGAKRRHAHKRGEGCIGHHCPRVGRSVGYGSSELVLSVDLPEGGLAGSTVAEEFAR